MMVGDEYNKLAWRRAGAGHVLDANGWRAGTDRRVRIPGPGDRAAGEQEMFAEPAAMAVWQKIDAVDQTRPSYNELLEPSMSAA